MIGCGHVIAMQMTFPQLAPENALVDGSASRHGSCFLFVMSGIRVSIVSR